MSFKDILVERARKSKLMKKIYLKVFSPYVDLHVRELSLTFDLQPAENESKRLNLLVPSISREHVFGGITTAFDYFNRIAGAGGFQKRIIIINAEPRDEEIRQYFPVTGWWLRKTVRQSNNACRQGSSPPHRSQEIILPRRGDAYCAQRISACRRTLPECPQAILYLIRDYEPGFYLVNRLLFLPSTINMRGRGVLFATNC